MSTISTEEVRSYYDAHVGGKLKGFVEGNARVECAWSTIERWAGEAPVRILEVGCGIGDICWRMSRRWTGGSIVGLDVSPLSLVVARKLFGDRRVRFVPGPLVPGGLDGRFDVIVLMDVYEHVARADRPALHSAIRDLRADNGRVILTFPTPRHLAWLRAHMPEQIQPVDEDITADAIVTLARDTGQDVLFYSEVGVWHEGDYAHAVLGTCAGWDTATPPSRRTALSRTPPPALVPSRRARLARVIDRLGPDVYPSAR